MCVACISSEKSSGNGELMSFNWFVCTEIKFLVKFCLCNFFSQFQMCFDSNDTDRTITIKKGIIYKTVKMQRQVM